MNALLDGVPASASIVPAKGSLLTPSGQSSFSLAKCASPQSVTVLGIDAAGNGMTGAGAPKVTLTSSAPQVLAVKPGKHGVHVHAVAGARAERWNVPRA